MSSRLDELGPDVVVALLTFTTPEALEPYQQRRRLSFDILLDPDRATYDAYGVERGSLRAVWGMATIKRYAAIIKHGGARDVQGATEDTRQLGADLVIAPNGTVAWAHWSTGPADRPSVDEIVGAVHAARGRSS